MSMFQSLTHWPFSHRSFPLSIGPATLLSQVSATLWHWNERYVQRRALAELDRRLLLDAGIDPDARVAELSKPFWKA